MHERATASPIENVGAHPSWCPSYTGAVGRPDDTFDNYMVIERLRRQALDGDATAIHDLVHGLIRDADRDSGNGAAVSPKVIDALKDIGAAAMPPLAKGLFGRPGERYGTFCALETAELAPLAAHVVDDLFRVVSDRKRTDRWRAARILVESGGPVPGEVIPIVAGELLEHENRVVRGRAAEVIGLAASALHVQTGEVPRLALDALVRALEDPEDFVQRCAIAAVIQLGVPDPAFRAPLRAGFKNSAMLQDDYARALATLGFDGDEVTEYALALVRTCSGEARAAALRLLLSASPDRTVPVDTAASMVARLPDRLLTADEIAEFHLMRPYSAEALGRAARGGNPTIADRALSVLVEMGEVDARPLLLERVEKASPSSRASALRTLARLHAADAGTDGAVGAAVLSRLDDSDPDVRLVAAQLAPQLRSAGAPLIDALRRRLDDADPRVRWASCVTLCTIEGDPADALPILEQALRGKLGERAHAVDLLGQYRRAEALHLLLTVIGNEDPSAAPIDTSTSDWWTGPIVNTSGGTVGQRAEAALSSMGIGVLPTLRTLAASLDGETARARALSAVARLERRPG